MGFVVENVAITLGGKPAATLSRRLTAAAEFRILNLRRSSASTPAPGGETFVWDACP
jgi:hypothetical protein